MMAGKSIQVMGIRLPEEIATAFTMEADKRNLRLDERLQKMWELHLKDARQERANDGG